MVGSDEERDVPPTFNVTAEFGGENEVEDEPVGPSSCNNEVPNGSSLVRQKKDKEK